MLGTCLSAVLTVPAVPLFVLPQFSSHLVGAEGLEPPTGSL